MRHGRELHDGWFALNPLAVSVFLSELVTMWQFTMVGLSNPLLGRGFILV